MHRTNVTLPPGVAELLKQRVRPRGRSAYVLEALELAYPGAPGAGMNNCESGRRNGMLGQSYVTIRLQLPGDWLAWLRTGSMSAAIDAALRVRFAFD